MRFRQCLFASVVVLLTGSGLIAHAQGNTKDMSANDVNNGQVQKRVIAAIKATAAPAVAGDKDDEAEIVAAIESHARYGSLKIAAAGTMLTSNFTRLPAHGMAAQSKTTTKTNRLNASQRRSGNVGSRYKR